MKKYFGVFVLFLIIGTAAFMYLSCSSQEERVSPNPGMFSKRRRGNVATLTMKSRKLKVFSPYNHLQEKSNIQHSDQDDGGIISLEDYRPIDPVPSSKASIRPGPIQHSAPLMPYIPGSAPPPGQTEYSGLP